MHLGQSGCCKSDTFKGFKSTWNCLKFRITHFVFLSVSLFLRICGSVCLKERNRERDLFTSAFGSWQNFLCTQMKWDDGITIKENKPLFKRFQNNKSNLLRLTSEKINEIFLFQLDEQKVQTWFKFIAETTYGVK